MRPADVVRHDPRQGCDGAADEMEAQVPAARSVSTRTVMTVMIVPAMPST